MGQNSNIEWTHHTFNPWRGCTKVSDGCKNCYADVLSHRNPKALGIWGPNGTRVIAAESYWHQPLKWEVAARDAGERHRVFCASLADVCEGQETMPADAWEPVQTARRRLGQLIDLTPNLDWLILTKRPENIPATFNVMFNSGVNPRRNIWWGTSVEDQKTADERIAQLVRIPAVVRFVSAEPLLGTVRLAPAWNHSNFDPEFDVSIDWVIVGGESGRGARPMHPHWARSIRDQCAAAGVPFFFKQWGDWQPLSTGDGRQILPFGEYVLPSGNSPGFGFTRVGKKAAGRLLDGREHNEFPTARIA